MCLKTSWLAGGLNMQADDVQRTSIGPVFIAWPPSPHPRRPCRHCWCRQRQKQMRELALKLRAAGKVYKKHRKHKPRRRVQVGGTRAGSVGLLERLPCLAPLLPPLPTGITPACVCLCPLRCCS